MKKILYIIILLAITGCYWDEDPVYPEYSDKYPNYDTLIYRYDTMVIDRKINGIPYIDDDIIISSDGYYDSGVYGSHKLSLNVTNGYYIDSIDWKGADITKMLLLAYGSNTRLYWCAVDITIDSIYLRLLKKTKYEK